MKDMKAVVGIFSSREKAERALTTLKDTGLTFTQMKLVTPEASATSDTAATETELETPGRRTRTMLSALMGGALGASGSLLGAAAVGLVAAGAPFIALGLPLAAIGGLTGAGVGVFAAETLEHSLLQPAYNQLCEEALKQGKSLVITLADDHAQAEQYRQILIEAGAENLNPSREKELVDLDSLDVGTVFAVPEEEVTDHTPFATPEEVLNHDKLSREQKIKILRRWYYDASSVAVAEEEGMIGDDNLMLQRIVHALHQLTGGLDREHSVPTKQGSL